MADVFSHLCPNCRQPMVSIGPQVDWKADGENWTESSPDEADWDEIGGGREEREEVWECPNCGHREYEP